MFAPLPSELLELFHQIRPLIKERLLSFKNVPFQEYFYELCFCICTPMTKAQNAMKVQKKLMDLNFKENDIDLYKIVRGHSHYIRFHNKKILYLEEMKRNFSIVEEILRSVDDVLRLRELLSKTVQGLSFKESSHFLRNIGKEGVAIIDRHTFRNLQQLGVVDLETKYPTSKNAYLRIEALWKEFSQFVNISVEEMDFLFFYNQTKTILK